MAAHAQGIDALHVTWPEYLIILSVATVGASVQGAIGFGANLMAVPVVAVFAPEALPAAMLFWAMPMTVAMVVREHHGVSWWSVGWATVGRLPGNAAGAWVVSAVASTTLSVIIGISVLLAVLVSVWAPTFDLTPTNITTAGFASGLSGTASSIGGPPLAVLYQHQKGPVLRSTMAAIFAIGTVTSTALLLVFGEVHAAL